MRENAFPVLLGIVVLIAVNAVLPFVKFSKSIDYVIFFTIIYSIANLVVPRLRVFLTLPDLFWADFVVHFVIMFLVFYLAHTLWGGVTVLPITIKDASFSLISIKPTQLDIIGATALGTFFLSAVYQGLIYFYNKK
jgi:hypothetical protein